MTLSEQSHDSEQNSRWLAWEEKSRRQDRIAEKRMKVVFVVLGVILLIALLYVLRRVINRPNLVEKGPTVACQWRPDPILPGMQQISQASLEVPQ
jgi:hypothetical protein